MSLTMDRNTGRTRRSLWIPWAFVGFFGVVFAVNAVLVTIALDSFNGMSIEGAYDRGIAYNQVLVEREAQKALGWRPSLAFEQEGEGFGTLDLRLEDAKGYPLKGADVLVELRRPAEDGHDLEVAMVEASPGRYEAEVALPLAGQWDARVRVEHSRGSLRVDERLFVK